MRPVGSAMVAPRLAASIWVACVAALFASVVEGVAVLRGAGASHGSRADPKAKVGEDCGQIHHVIKKFSKATQVGKLSGLARAAVTHADAAAGVTVNVVKQAKSDATTLGDPETLTKIVADAEAAGTEASGASTALGTRLDTFKGKISASEYSGADVEQSDIDELKKLTEKANEAAELAYSEAKRLSQTTEKAVSAAMKDTQKVAKLASAAVKTADATLDTAAKAKHNATWATDDAADLEEKAAAMSKEIEDVMANASTQAPVWKALKDAVDSEVDGVTKAKDAVTKAITPLDTAVSTLKGKITPVKEAATSASSGSIVTSAIHEELSALETAKTEAAELVADLQGEVKTLEYRQEHLKTKMEEAQEKLG